MLDFRSFRPLDPFMKRALRHPQFMNVFIEILTYKPYSEFKDLLLTTHTSTTTLFATKLLDIYLKV
jgi:hypothetical protein